MRKGTCSCFTLAAVCFLLIPQTVFATDHGIVISGGDENDDISDWREQTLDKFSEELERRGVDEGNIQRPGTEEDVKNAIKGLKGKVKCGDNIVIYFNGHGNRFGGLCMVNEDEEIYPREMLKWLKEAQLACCCKVHLVIHACYSGNFVKEMVLGNSHIVAGVSSSSYGREGHKDLIPNTATGEITFPGSDWPTGFNEGLAKVDKNLGWQETLQEAKKTAKEKMRDKWKRDKPATWKRFEGHVVEITQEKAGGPKKVKLQGKDGKTHTVVLKRGSKLKVGNMEREYCELTVCSQMSALVQESDEGDCMVKASPEVTLNIKDAWGHVQGVDRDRGTIRIHFQKPACLNCKTVELKMKEGSTIPHWVRPCKWLTIDEGHYFPPSGIRRRDYKTTKAKDKISNIEYACAHVQAVDRDKGTITIDLKDPKTGKRKTVKLKMKKRTTIPDWVKPCTWLMIYKGDLLPAPEIHKVSERQSPLIGFTGHVQSVDRDKGEILVHIRSPRWLKCKTKKIKMKEGAQVPSWVEECKWTRFEGKLTDVGIVDVSTMIKLNPVGMGYSGHVREVDREAGIITVHIQSPEWLLCRTKELKLPGGAIPEWVKPCCWISFQGPLTSGPIELTAWGDGSYVRETAPVRMSFKGHVEKIGEDEIEVHIIEPEQIKCQRKKVRMESGVSIPEGIAVCNTITFNGYLTDGIIEAGNIAVANYFVVDDFESYGEVDVPGEDGGRIQYTWMDGLGWRIPSPGYEGNGTGSSVNIDSVTVYGGEQSMRFDYDNTGAFRNIFGDPITVHYSEAERAWDTAQDWTAHGIKALSLWLYGDPNNDPNAAEQTYVAVQDNLGTTKVVPYGGDPGDMTEASWHEWNIDLKEFNEAGVNMANIKKLYIGVGNRDHPEPGGTGTLYIDDIRLYQPRCVPSLLRPDADLSGDCAVGYADLEIITGQWLGIADEFWRLESDLQQNGQVNFRDYAVLADMWLDEQLWPEP